MKGGSVSGSHCRRSGIQLPRAESGELPSQRASYSALCGLGVSRHECEGCLLGSEFSQILPAHCWWESLGVVRLPRLGGHLWSQPVQTSPEGPWLRGSTRLSTESSPTAQLPLA